MPAGLAIPGMSATAAASPTLQPSGTGWGLGDRDWHFMSVNGGPLNANPPDPDPRFTALGINRVRLIVPWDLVPPSGPNVPKPQSEPEYTGMLAKVDYWLILAGQLKLDILVSFDHGLQLASGWTRNGVPNENYLPGVGEYGHAVQAFRARYTWVRAYTAWNEPNHPAEPTYGHEFQTGQFWRKLHWQCTRPGGPQCVVAAGDFADGTFFHWRTPDGVDHPYKFREYLHGTGVTPSIWAWHAYLDGLNRTSTWLSKFKARLPKYKKPSGQLAPPLIWLSEQGGWVTHETRCGQGSPTGSCLTAATDDFKHILSLPAKINSYQLTRLYAYQWRGDSGWDSGILDRTDKTRQMYCELMKMTNPASASTCVKGAGPSPTP